MWLALVGALLGIAAGGALAYAQVCTDPGAPVDTRPPSILVVMDASKSMAEPIGDGKGTRLDAAKEALRFLVRDLPAGTRVGLRLYGHRDAGADRSVACRDTELVSPIQPLDRAALTARIDSYRAVGRTPIGRALRAGAQDLPADGPSQIVLVSDGGDNCAPPDPCDVAAQLGRDGRAITVQAVGFLVTERARRQLQCIARRGGGAYTDVGDPAQLGFALRAAAARGSRAFAATGRAVTGGPTASRPAPVAAGTARDTIGVRQERWYSVLLGAGQRLGVAATLPTPCERTGAAAAPTLELDVRAPGAAQADSAATGQVTGLFTRPSSVGGTGVLTPAVGTTAAFRRPGRYLVRVALQDAAGGALEQALGGRALPVQLRVDVLGTARRPAAAPSTTDDGDGGGGGGPSVVLLALGGAVLGALLGTALLARRRT